MAFWNKSKGDITDQQRLTLLNLAVDEDFSLHEVSQKFPDLVEARAVMRDLIDRQMVNFFWKQPKGGREEIERAEIDVIIDGDAEWARSKSFKEAYVIVAANDQGWRWHQKHWKSA